MWKGYAYQAKNCLKHVLQGCAYPPGKKIHNVLLDKSMWRRCEDLPVKSIRMAEGALSCHTLKYLKKHVEWAGRFASVQKLPSWLAACSGVPRAALHFVHP